MRDFNEAVERIIAGLENRAPLQERRVVAHHELGHAMVAMALPGTDPVHKVSIIPRGVGALGYTIQRPTEDRFLMTREELENKMAVLLGGRAAEEVVFGISPPGRRRPLQGDRYRAQHGDALRHGEEPRHVAYEESARRSSAVRCRKAIANTARRPRARSTSRCATS